LFAKPHQAKTAYATVSAQVKGKEKNKKKIVFQLRDPGALSAFDVQIKFVVSR